MDLGRSGQLLRKNELSFFILFFCTTKKRQYLISLYVTHYLARDNGADPSLPLYIWTDACTHFALRLCL